MAAQNDEVTKNEPIEWFVIAFITLAVSIFLLKKYHMDIWYYSKLPILSAMSYVPKPVRQVLFFYTPNSVEIAELAVDDLRHHRQDFRSYYKDDPVGQRKKSGINKSTWAMFAPYSTLFFLFVIYRELKKRHGQITKPGKRHAMYGYIKTMQEIFPYIKPALPYMEKVSKMESLDEGWFACAKIPSAWVKEKQLTNTLQYEKQRTLIVKRQRVNFVLNEDATYEALREQLGKPWSGLKDLGFIERCALVIILPQIYGQVKSSRLNNRHFLNNLDTLRAIMSVKDHKGVVPAVPKEKQIKMKAFVDGEIKKYEHAFVDPWFELMQFEEPFDPILASFESLDSDEHVKNRANDMIQQVLLGFRYTNSIFLALFDRAWMYGVLSSSEIMWIKEFDRPLYYIFAQQGRLSCFVEAAGPWAHYLAEKAHGYRMLSPQLYEAMLSIDRDLFETHDNYRAIVDWSDSARWNKMVPDLTDSTDGVGAGKTTRSGVSSLL